MSDLADAAQVAHEVPGAVTGLAGKPLATAGALTPALGLAACGGGGGGTAGTTASAAGGGSATTVTGGTASSGATTVTGGTTTTGTTTTTGGTTTGATTTTGTTTTGGTTTGTTTTTGGTTTTGTTAGGTTTTGATTTTGGSTTTGSSTTTGATTTGGTTTTTTSGTSATGSAATGSATTGGATVVGGAVTAPGASAPSGTGSAPAPADTTPVTVVPTAVTPVQASRFLTQATMGATRATIDDVVARGYEAWLADQFALPRATTHFDWMMANGYGAANNSTTFGGIDASIWRQLIAEPDQLRQRVGMALLDFIVVGFDGITWSYPHFSLAAYVDLLLDNAFGNYRTLLGAITTNPAMSAFLTFNLNRKANPATDSHPDENYAREIIQLFTIGLYQLNMDGTLKTSGGQPIETYTQADVSGLARIFTGLGFPVGSVFTTPDFERVPLAMYASLNETGASTFLGTTITGGGMAGVNKALDTIFNHPNVAPFVSKQLIQRLVTSNPSPAYVGRVAAVFANNGQGVRGDLKAVVHAILMDTEARDDATALASSTVGKLREPVMRLTAWARAYNVTSPSNAWAIGDTSNPATRLGQSMGRSPSVFGWFRPGYTPPATAIATAGLVAPEFQLANEQSVIGYINYMYGLVANGTGDVKADYTDILTKASDSAALVAEVNLVLAAGQLSAATIASITAAVNSVSYSATNGPINRVGIAIVLTLAAPEFLTVK